jgi:hypothetical protein
MGRTLSCLGNTRIRTGLTFTGNPSLIPFDSILEQVALVLNSRAPGLHAPVSIHSAAAGSGKLAGTHWKEE